MTPLKVWRRFLLWPRGRSRQREDSRLNMANRLDGTMKGSRGRESKREAANQEASRFKRPRDQCHQND